MNRGFTSLKNWPWKNKVKNMTINLKNVDYRCQTYSPWAWSSLWNPGPCVLNWCHVPDAVCRVNLAHELDRPCRHTLKYSGEVQGMCCMWWLCQSWLQGQSRSGCFMQCTPCAGSLSHVQCMWPVQPCMLCAGLAGFAPGLAPNVAPEQTGLVLSF